MSKERTFIKGKVKPLQYGAKALSIHKDSIKMSGDWFNIVIASKKDGSGDYMYLDEFEPKPQTQNITNSNNDPDLPF